jgi:hypothetical protein
MAGWGNFFGKIGDWLPGRKESMLNRIEAIKKELYAIQTKSGAMSARDADKYTALSNELDGLQQKAGNAS